MFSDKVPCERCQQAQQWEAGLWRGTQQRRAKFRKELFWRLLKSLRLVDRYRGNNWNTWWHDRFGGYRILPLRGSPTPSRSVVGPMRRATCEFISSEEALLMRCLR
jgi:hypothetical protein